MDYLWTPWRYAYLTQANREGGCIFCEKQAAAADRDNYVVYRGGRHFVMLNLYPYTVGHLLIVPYRHIASLTEAEPAELAELMELTCRAEAALRKVYQPHGLNLGMNLGAAAGAGVAGHLHMHVLPRWVADSNFLTAVGETRVLPEELSTTWAKLRAEFQASRLNAGSAASR
jgi:ATP adenylyltransferase